MHTEHPLTTNNEQRTTNNEQRTTNNQQRTMIPGEYFFDGPDLELNGGRPTAIIQVNNTGDRPIQIGSHYHFFETNRALVFDRETAYGMRLDLPAGTAVRIEPGEIKTVRLVALGGERRVYGGSGLVMGSLDDAKVREKSLERMRREGFGNLKGAAF
ncbi:MAG: urease subunit beta [Gemmataceae bacterium]